MRIANLNKDQVMLNPKNQNDKIKNENRKKQFNKPSGVDQDDQVSIKTRGNFKTDLTDIDKNSTTKPQELLSNLTDKIKEHSIAASKSHSNLDPSMILSLFKD